jgi:hypothetical protein
MIIATLATNLAQNDLRIFVQTLALWNKELPTLYLYADDTLPPVEYGGRLVRSSALNKYTGYNRTQMEKMPSTSASSLWMEFQMEKLNLLDWVFASDPEAEKGVFYFDADICFLGPLPEVPSYAEVAISPHMIYKPDTKRSGVYNAGFLWMKTKAAVDAWRAACPTSRYFEQAALECFDSWNNVYHFPVQHNYGWWRFFQGDKGYASTKDEWAITNIPNHSGLLVQGIPVCSVHTHWKGNDYQLMVHFNAFLVNLLMKMAKTSKNVVQVLNIIMAPDSTQSKPATT